MAYGPASFNGLSASATDDGLLHVEGTSQVAHRGIQWDLPILDTVRNETVNFTSFTALKGCYAYVHITGADKLELGNITTGQSTLIPAEATALQLRVAASSSGTAISGDYKIQLEIGDTATEWTRPDDTDNRGGGYELENLFPDLASDTVKGITYTRVGDRTWHISGKVQETYSGIGLNVDFDPGTYQLTSKKDAALGLNANAQVARPDGSWLSNNGQITVTERTSLRCQIAVNDTTGKQIDGVIGPVSLVRIE